MKKLLSVFIIVALAINVSTLTINASAEDKNFQSKAVFLCDYNTGTVLKSKNENARMTIASMCKIMTLLLVFEEIDIGNIDYNDVIPISENSEGMGGSQAFLETGGEYRAEDLIKSIIIASANDSCVAFAEKISGSEHEFVNRMNEKAKKLGMRNTLFSNCTGLPKPTQYSCAKDVALMFRELITHKEYFKFSNIWMDEIQHPKGRVTGLTNTNKLIKQYEGCDGGKTGYTSESGHCLVATAKRGNMRLISVVISSPDSKTRFNEISDCFNYGFANFTNKTIIDSSVPLKIRAKIQGGVKDNVEIIAKNDFYSFAKKNEEENFRVDFQPFEKIKAPLKQGDEVGELIIYKDNQEIGRIKCASNEDVNKTTYFGTVIDVMRCWKL